MDPSRTDHRPQIEILQIVARMAGVGWFERDLRTNQSTWSDELYELYGLVPGSVTSDRDLFLSFQHPEDRPDLINFLQTLESSSSDRPRILHHRIVRRDGQVRALVSVVSVLTDAAGNSARLVGASMEAGGSTPVGAGTDDESGRRAEPPLPAEFFAYMSHDIRTALNAIVGLSGLLGESAGPSAARDLGMLRKAADNLLAIVNDLLDFSRLETGADNLAPRNCDPVALIREVVEPLAAGGEIVIEFDFSDDFPALVNVDEAKLRRVILNLASNALKYGGAGPVRITGRLLAPLRLDFEVSDSGPGMSPAEMKHIWDPYFQLVRSDRREGLGLGLAIARSLIRLLGGTISVWSEPGAGTVFRFQIPAGPPIAEPAQASRPLRLAGRSILIVEDDPVSASILERMLGQFAADSIEIIADGEAGLRRAEQHPRDIVFVDRQLPRLDGLAVIRGIRACEKREGRPRTRIVVVTAEALPFSREECLEAGCDDFLAKPVTLRSLAATLQS